MTTQEFNKLPQEVRDIISELEPDGNDYDALERVKGRLECIGWTFDYYLDAEPFDLRPIGRIPDGSGCTLVHDTASIPCA